MRFTLKNPRFLQYIDYQNVRKTEFLGCQSQEMADFGNVQNPPFAFFSMSLSTYVASTSSATGNYSSVTKWCLPGARVLVSRELSGPGMRAVAVVPAGISTVHSNLSPVRFQLLTIFP